jgi:hypothetical protein
VESRVNVLVLLLERSENQSSMHAKVGLMCSEGSFLSAQLSTEIVYFVNQGLKALRNIGLNEGYIP